MSRPRTSGHASLFARLPTERALAAAARLDTLPARAVVELLTREERRSVAAARRAAPAIARVALLAARALARGGRIIYVGAGTSGRLANLDAAECPPTFGTRPAQVIALVAGGARALRRAVEGAEDDATAARRRLARLRPSRRDLVVGIAASGVTPFTRAALAAARARGCATALVTCAPRPARGLAGIVIALDTGPEVLAGSTRLKAGTATKLALNAISTAAMVLSGKCYGPRMVDVRAGSAKLRARARRIVAELGRVPPARAAALLAASGGSAKTAIVMARLGVGARVARRRLAAARGSLRRVIG